jgi:hypothetical protein
MKDWHFEHMQKTILKYVSGLTETFFLEGKTAQEIRNDQFLCMHNHSRGTHSVYPAYNNRK